MFYLKILRSKYENDLFQYEIKLTQALGPCCLSQVKV